MAQIHKYNVISLSLSTVLQFYRSPVDAMKTRSLIGWKKKMATTPISGAHLKQKKGAKIFLRLISFSSSGLTGNNKKKRQLRHYKRVERQESNKDEDDDQEFHPARIFKCIEGTISI